MTFLEFPTQAVVYRLKIPQRGGAIYPALATVFALDRASMQPTFDETRQTFDFSEDRAYTTAVRRHVKCVFVAVILSCFKRFCNVKVHPNRAHQGNRMEEIAVGERLLESDHGAHFSSS